MRLVVPLRHPVTPGAEHAVEGAAGNGEFFAAVGGDDLLDQRVECGALNAGEVSKLYDNPGGFYLYKVESKRTLPLTEVKEEIQRKLQPEKLNDARKAITEKVKSNFNEKYFGGPVAAAGAAPAPGKSSTTPAGTAKQPSPAPKTGTTTHKTHTAAATATH